MSNPNPQPNPIPDCSCTCAPPQPWTCNPSEITQNSYISPFGCKKPQEIYNPTTHQCCACSCDPNEFPAEAPATTYRSK